MTGPTVTLTAHFHRAARGRKRLKDKAPEPVVVHGERIPRTTQLLALAIRFEQMIRNGEAKSYAELSRRAGVSRARVTQIIGGLDLSLETQERMLLLRTSAGAGSLGGGGNLELRRQTVSPVDRGAVNDSGLG